jgi:hypothetical protein
MCIVCGKHKCHSSNHKEHARNTLMYLADFRFSQEEKCDNEADGDEEESSEAIGLLMITQITTTLNSSFQFLGIALDTCAHFKNTVVEQVFRAMKLNWPNLFIDPEGEEITVNGVGGKNNSIGNFTFSFSFGGRRCSVPVHVIPGNTPLVMSRYLE